ncbi:MAG: hypothetical protein LBN08_06955 [Lactobacillales bacterium]|jgi:very-short-patch-repair endonuclease|nr:hypothetical protein [Lactobacillales bacterium]
MKIENDVLSLLTEGCKLSKDEKAKYYKIGRGYYYPRYEWFALYEIDQFKLRILATASQTNSDAYFSGVTAAIAYGCPMPAGIAKFPFRPEITHTKSRRVKSKYATYKVSTVPCECEIINICGISATVMSPPTFIVDVAKNEPLINVFPIAEYCLYERIVSKFDIENAIINQRYTQGISRVRKIFKLLSELSESVAESATKAILIENNLELPIQQRKVGKYRADFLWPALKLVLEFDGFDKFINLGKRDIIENLENMFERDDCFASNGYRIMHVLYSYLLHPEKLVKLLKDNSIPTRNYGL